MVEQKVTRHYLPVEAGYPTYTINRLCEQLKRLQVEGQIFMEFVIFNGLYKPGDSVPEKSKEALVRLPLSDLTPEDVVTTMTALYQQGKGRERVYPGNYGYRIVFEASDRHSQS